MQAIESRLESCFRTVLPDIRPENIKTATMDTVPQWDSMATVLLITVIEEEFGVTLDPSDFDRMTSFQSILSYLQAMDRTA